MTTPDWQALRKEFPTLERWTYLDVARKTIPPRAQEQALLDYTRDVYENAGANAWAASNTAEARSSMEHLANVWVWKHWQTKGVEIRYAANRDGRLPLESFLEKMDTRTRVVSTAY